MATLTIGKLSQATDVKVPTIRFYEQVGLMPEPSRTANDRRTYGEDAVRRLRFIRHARQLGFDIKDIETLLHLADTPDMPCGDADRITSQQLATVEAKIVQLERLRVELSRIVGCRAETVGQCRVIEALSDCRAQGPDRSGSDAPR